MRNSRGSISLEGLLMIGSVVLVVVLLGIGLVYGIAEAKADRICKDAGWREASVAYNLQAYCHREENEYEITVPIEEVH